MHIFTFEIIRAATVPLRCDQFPGGCILSSLVFLQPQCLSFCPHFIALGAQPIVLLFVVSLSHADASSHRIWDISLYNIMAEISDCSIGYFSDGHRTPCGLFPSWVQLERDQVVESSSERKLSFSMICIFC